jgi:Tol biopolymer transport system component
MKQFGVLILLAMLVGADALRAQSGYELLQQGISKELVEGNLQEAIALYQRVVREFGSDRVLVAKALVQLGGAHEKVGSSEARTAYTRVVNEFGDQPQAVAEARRRMATLSDPARDASARSGLSTRQLWSGEGVDVMGSITRDGRHLTFTDWLSGGNLAIRDLRTGEIRRLTKDAAANPGTQFGEFSVISRDGLQIAYSWYSREGYGLRVVGRDGSSPRVLYANPDVEWVRPLAWAPDGKTVAALFGRVDETNQIVLVSAAAGAVRVLKSLDWRTPESLAYSPDGRYIAYDFPPTTTLAQRDVYVMSTDASRETAVVKHAADDRLLGWFPDGERLLFVSDRGGSPGAWAVRLRDGKPAAEPELVKPDIGRVLPFGFSDEHDFYYSARMGLLDVFTVDLDPATGKATQPAAALSHRSGGEKLQAAWSPDGTRLLYGMRSSERVGGNPRLLGVLDTRTGVEQVLPVPLRYVQWPAWMPGGRALIVQGPDLQGRAGLHKLDLASNSLERLTDGGRLQPSVTPDGNTVVYFTQPKVAGNELLNVTARDLRTGGERVLHSGAASRFAISPDGRQLVIRVPPATGERPAPEEIKIVSTADGSSRTLLRVGMELSTPPVVAWSADGKFVFFSKGREAKTELWRVAVADGSAAPVGVALPRIQRVSAHPNGKSLVISAGMPKWEVWVLENVPGSVAATSVRK